MATSSAIGISAMENTANINVLRTDGQNTESWNSSFLKLARPTNVDSPIPFQSSIPLYMDTRMGTNTIPI